jgi:outer membrane protein OmpA-like peptidoglycan-associated protein
MGASLAIAAVFSSPDARAQFYIGPEGGWTGLEGTRSSIAGFPINQSFNSGFNVGARAGYQWDTWRFEGEYSYRQNASNATAFGSRLNGTVDTNSFMANAIYDFNLNWPLTPHIGVGVGAAELNGNINGPNVGFQSRTSDAVFAYQAIAGIRYKFTPNLALDVDYRYRGTADATFQTRPFVVNGVAVPGARYTGSGNTNNVVASLTWLFAPAPPPPPMAAAMSAPPPPPPPKVFVVFFDWDKATITPEGMGVIQQGAAAFRSGAPVQIQVTGYTDRSGSPGYNQRLSEQRANNVASALIGLGVAQNQLAVSGRGENDNRVPTADGVREPQNRRVEIVSS